MILIAISPNFRNEYEGIMANLSKTYDVLISHSSRDSVLALEIANSCRESGLEAITSKELPPDENMSDAIWDAVAESRALLIILSPSGPTASMGIEIGAARAWNKPIYAVITDPSSMSMAPALTGVSLYTPGRIQDVIRSIRASVEKFTDKDRVILTELYSELEVSADQLALDPGGLGLLVRRFERRTGKAVEGERLLSELLRLRKQGVLARKRSAAHKKPRREPA